MAVAAEPSVDERWMAEAMREADLARDAGDVPIGAVVVDASGELLARAHNEREARQDPTAHAEIYALRAAAASVGHWRLAGATVYVTLEPCPMCAGALVHARVARVVFGCADPKAGAVESLFSIGQDARLNHRFTVERGVLGEACAAQLSDFFLELRAKLAKRRADRERSTG